MITGTLVKGFQASRIPESYGTRIAARLLLCFVGWRVQKATNVTVRGMVGFVSW